MGKIKLFKIIGQNLVEREIHANTDKKLQKKVEVWGKTGWVTEAQHIANQNLASKLTLTEAVLDKKNHELLEANEQNAKLQKLVEELTAGASKAKEAVKKAKDITPTETE